MFHVHFHYSRFVRLLFFIEGQHMSDIGFICWNNTDCKGLKTVQMPVNLP